MPAQHGSSAVLDRMRRGYTRAAYVDLVQRARGFLGRGSPEGVAMGLSSDFISGFCGETEEEHNEVLSLVRQIGFDQAFTYSYSRRDQTYAGLFLQDDVHEAVKARRLTELVETFQESVQARNQRLEVGRLHLVLCEGEAKKSGSWTGRTDSNKRIVFRDPEEGQLLDGIGADEACVLALASASENAVAEALVDLKTRRQGGRILEPGLGRGSPRIAKGVYIVVKVFSARGQTLRGMALATTTLKQGFEVNLPALPTSQMLL